MVILGWSIFLLPDVKIKSLSNKNFYISPTFSKYLVKKSKHKFMDTIKKSMRDSALLRWVVLILISFLTFGTYWFQDFYSGLKGLMETQLDFSSSDFGLLISSTTWLNLFGAIIIGGIIIGSLYFGAPIGTMHFVIAFMVIVVLGVEEVCSAIRDLKK